MRTMILIGVVGVLCVLAAAMAAQPVGGPEVASGASLAAVERKTCTAPDGVTIVYSAAGAGEPALVFIHGGLADRSFYNEQLAAFSGRYRVIALDLAGHGESGTNRKKWGMPEFGGDIKAVVDAEKLDKVILFGNSLGGPAAIEGALLLGKKVIGVVGIDTFQSLDYEITPEEAKARAEAFRKDYAGSMKAMVKALFHPDADPAVMADAERRMLKNSPETAYQMFMGLAGYKPADAARRLTVPLRAINGDIYPTDLASVRKVVPGFDAIIMKHMGHYPMLERPKEFDEDVEKVIKELWGRASSNR